MIFIPGVSKEQIAQAKEWDLLTYLQIYEPHELKQCGPHEYCTQTHDSLKISNGKWCWNSQGIGGRTALDCLIKVRGMDFVGAVETLCGHRAPPPQQPLPPKPRKLFALPEASRFPSKVLAYLQDRGIHPDVLKACIQADTLYESRKYQNCVFVGRDMEGRARFACLRGTRDNFRLDVESSDKRYNFSLPASDAACPRLVVAESPIDALSLATLVKLSGASGGVATIFPSAAPRPVLCSNFCMTTHTLPKSVYVWTMTKPGSLAWSDWSRPFERTRNCPSGSS